MKKLIYGLLSFAALSVVSCDYHDPNEDKFGNDPQAGWVQFAEQGVTYYSVTPGFTTEGQFETSIPVVIDNPLNRGVNIDGLTVEYSVADVTGAAPFIVSQGKITLDKGVTSAAIPFTVPTSAQVTCAEYIVTLTSTSRSDVTVGFETNNIITHRVVVGYVNRDALTGTYDVFQLEYNRDEPTQDPIESEYVSVVTAGTEANELVFSNIYGESATSQTHAFINPDGTLSFPDLIDNYLYTAGGDTGNVYLLGKKGFTSCINVIGFEFDLRFGPGQTSIAGPMKVEMTKQ